MLCSKGLYSLHQVVSFANSIISSLKEFASAQATVSWWAPTEQNKPVDTCLLSWPYIRPKKVYCASYFVIHTIIGKKPSKATF